MQVRAETPPTCSFTRRLLAALTVPSFRPPNPSLIHSPSFRTTASAQPADFPPEEKTTFFYYFFLLENPGFRQTNFEWDIPPYSE
jgi:hypothetical protein